MQLPSNQERESCPECGQKRHVMTHGKMDVGTPAPYGSNTQYCIACGLFFDRTDTDKTKERSF